MASKNQKQPPKLAINFLRWFCKERLFEEIEGDLFEYYQLYLQKNPHWKAKIYYCRQLLSFMRQYSIKKKTRNSKYSIMINNYFKFSFRYLKKHPTSALLNILSLSIGIACFLFIFIYVSGEFSYDRYHKDSDKIHRVVIDLVNNGERLPDATTPPALAPALKANLPEVAEATRIFPTWGSKYLMGVTPDRQFYEEYVLRVDHNFLEIFSYEILQGDLNSMLDDPSKIVLTKSMVKKYFGDEDPMGKEITFFSLDNAKKIVSGVIEDVPYNSHFHFDFLRPLHFESRNIDENWGWYNYYTYIKLKDGTIHADFEEKLQPLYLSNNPNDSISPNITYSQPLEDIHLKSSLKWELGSNNNMSNIKIFISIGVFILIISLINYLNLTIGTLSRRTKEAGVRRTFGAARGNLVSQFVIESLTVIFISILLGSLLAELTLTQMDALFGREISLFDAENLRSLVILSLVTLTFGILSGIYPAFHFSSLGKDKSIISHKKDGFFDLKRVLLIVQFTISAIMIIGTMVVYKQLNYFKKSKMGFNMDQVLIVENIESSGANPGVFKERVNQLPFVETAGYSNGVVGGLNWTFSTGYPDRFLMNYAVVSPEYMEAMEFEFVAGRNFDPARESDAQGYNFIVNEAAMKELSISPDQVGEAIPIDSNRDSLIYGTVLGVVKDFHFSNFKSEIKPYCFFYRRDEANTMAIKMNTKNLNANLEILEDLWNEMAIGVPFESYFLDQSFAKLHETEERLSKAMLGLTILSIFIALMGMLAIVNIVIKSSLKEVAVRKTLGATTGQVVNLFSKKFLTLVLIANFIGLPIAWFIMNEWLSDFAYRTVIDPILFLLAFVLTFAIAYLIVGSRSYRAANSDLTRSLMDE